MIRIIRELDAYCDLLRYSMACHISPITAGLRMDISAHSLEYVFKDALAGMMDLLKPGVSGKARGVERTIQVTAKNLSTLLVDFLNEALASAYANREIYTGLRFRTLSTTTVEALLNGRAMTEFDRNIKAVTQRRARVEENSDRGDWTSRLVISV